jgi:hypothetical protein
LVQERAQGVLKLVLGRGARLGVIGMDGVVLINTCRGVAAEFAIPIGIEIEFEWRAGVIRSRVHRERHLESDPDSDFDPEVIITVSADDADCRR